MEFKELVQRIHYFDHFNQYGKKDPIQHKVNKENLITMIEAEKLTKIQKDNILAQCGKLFDENYKWAKATYPNNTVSQSLWNQGRGPEVKTVIKSYLKLK
jgi:hypothetical protein